MYINCAIFTMVIVTEMFFIVEHFNILLFDILLIEKYLLCHCFLIDFYTNVLFQLFREFKVVVVFTLFEMSNIVVA